MDYKEAIILMNDVCDFVSGSTIDKSDKKRKLKSFIESQQVTIDGFIQERKDFVKNVQRVQKKLSELEEDCPDCVNGLVEKFPDKSFMNSHPQPIEVNCPACSGSGKVPICYLPDEVVEMMIQRKHKMPYICKRSGSNKYPMFFGNREYGEVVKQPNNLWKLEKSHKELL